MPSSARRTRSPSLTMPSSLPDASTTGSALIRLASICSAASLAVASGAMVTTWVVMISAAFILSLLVRPFPHRGSLRHAP